MGALRAGVIVTFTFDQALRTDLIPLPAKFTGRWNVSSQTGTVASWQDATHLAVAFSGGGATGPPDFVQYDQDTPVGQRLVGLTGRDVADFYFLL